MTTSEIPLPQVGDAYWFELSKTMVSGAFQKLDQAAALFQNLALWAWGIYTASASVGFALAGRNLALVPTLVIASASILLIATYWCAVWAQTPPSMVFDPKVPHSIESAYNSNIKSRRSRLKFTMVMSAVAAGAVALAIVVASVPGPSKPPIGRLDSSITTDDSGHRYLSITTVGLPESGEVSLMVQPTISADPRSEKEYRTVLRATKEGIVQTSLPVLNPAAAFVVSLEWSDPAGQTTRLTRTAAVPKNTASH